MGENRLLSVNRIGHNIHPHRILARLGGEGWASGVAVLQYQARTGSGTTLEHVRGTLARKRICGCDTQSRAGEVEKGTVREDGFLIQK